MATIIIKLSGTRLVVLPKTPGRVSVEARLVSRCTTCGCDFPTVLRTMRAESTETTTVKRDHPECSACRHLDRVSRAHRRAIAWSRGLVEIGLRGRRA